MKTAHVVGADRSDLDRCIDEARNILENPEEYPQLGLLRERKSALNATRGRGPEVGICKVEDCGVGIGTSRSPVVKVYRRSDARILSNLEKL